MQTKLLQEENRVSRLSMRNLGIEDEIGGSLNSRIHHEEKFNAAPEIEMTKTAPVQKVSDNSRD